MSLKLMYITNVPEIAIIAQKSGVDRIWVDLEVKGKEERQKNMNTVKSQHTIDDIYKIAAVVDQSELMVRINPWDEDSADEVEKVIAAGAQRIMLPMWKTPEEADSFLKAVNKRVATTLLLETKEAMGCLETVLENPLVEEIHIGLNDLHLSFGLDFMFELLTNGTVEAICDAVQEKNIPCGFGGIACIGEGLLPAERILYEHVRLNSKMVILSRAFIELDQYNSLEEIEEKFALEVSRLRQYEAEYAAIDEAQLQQIHYENISMMNEIIAKLRNNL